MKCFYHKADLDGHCSGALVKLACPECEMFPIDYGDSFPWDLITNPDEVIFMVDFSLPPQDMERLDKLLFPCRLHWFDHHSTAIKSCVNSQHLLGKRSTDKAACELVFETFSTKLWFPRSLTCNPLVVDYLGKYDSWRHNNDPDILGYQYGMRALDLDPANPEAMVRWSEILEDRRGSLSMSSIITSGKMIQAYETKQNADNMQILSFKTSFHAGGKDLRALAINRGPASSLLFQSQWDPEKYDLMVAFVWEKHQWKVSLYTTHPEIHCGKIAKLYGGGGHPGAAGFHCCHLGMLGAI
jgi:oligoribonuclease NrnB/cAMP/cGMP phosphodiesterase (DHH superfamily)